MEIRVRGYGKSFRAGYNECNEMWKEKIREYAKSIVDDDIYKMNCCYDVNGTKIRKELEELLKND